METDITAFGIDDYDSYLIDNAPMNQYEGFNS